MQCLLFYFIFFSFLLPNRHSARAVALVQHFPAASGIPHSSPSYVLSYPDPRSRQKQGCVVHLTSASHPVQPSINQKCENGILQMVNSPDAYIHFFGRLAKSTCRFVLHSVQCFCVPCPKNALSPNGSSLPLTGTVNDNERSAVPSTREH
ncbi:hypothetical protein LZ32DRAFT_603294 [Colletotrichum eremochloae]|nr:hypothetical protein LZ32DRAFT_603294 [Colletotrichum eremochloae]